MQEHPWFKDWFNSPYYHHLYFKRDEKEAATFIDRLIDHLKPKPGTQILDVACGRGRHSIHLAQKGFEVTGIDLSEDSINEALKYQTEKLHFYQHDMRLPFWINYFDYAFNFFTSFGYFKTKREHDNAIRTIAQALNNTGCFVLDYLNTQYAEAHLAPHSTKEIEGTVYHLTKWVDEKHFYKKIIIEDEKLQEPLQYIEKVMKFSLANFTEMLDRQGLQVNETFGDYNFAKYDVMASPRLIMIANKK